MKTIATPAPANAMLERLSSLEQKMGIVMTDIARLNSRLDDLASRIEHDGAMEPSCCVADPVEKWAGEMVIRRRGNFVLASDLRASFEVWCAAHGLMPGIPQRSGAA